MRIRKKILWGVLAATLPLLFGFGIIALVILNPIMAVASMWDKASDFFSDLLNYDMADLDVWNKRDLSKMSQYAPAEYSQYYLAEAVSYFYFIQNGQSIVADSSGWDEYMQCFKSGSTSDSFDRVEGIYDYYLADEEKKAIVSFSSSLKRQYAAAMGLASGGTVISAVGDIKIDFDSKYYVFSSDRVNGSPCVCDAYNNVAWPYNNCSSLSHTGGWNKMICSSYASSRYWEVNYPDEEFPLNNSWDNDLHYTSKYKADPNHPVAGSIVGIVWSGARHDAFIESVFPDGSVIISECNVNNRSDDPVMREYGFRAGLYPSLNDWISSFGRGAQLVGIIPPM